MARAIVSSGIAIALLGAGGCAGAGAPTKAAPVEVSISNVATAGATDPDTAAASNDGGAGGTDMAVASEAEMDPGTLGVGDQAHHEALKLPQSGFYRVVSSTPVVTVTQNGVQHEAQTKPPFMNSYFLDGVHKHSVQSTCVDTCKPTKGQSVDLVDHVEEGTRPGPRDGEGPIPVFRTIDLKGSIDITFEYFADSNCRVKKVFKKKLKR